MAGSCGAGRLGQVQVRNQGRMAAACHRMIITSAPRSDGVRTYLGDRLAAEGWVARGRWAWTEGGKGSTNPDQTEEATCRPPA